MDRKNFVLKKINEIAEVLINTSSNSISVGLLTGNTGVALFLYNFWLWTKKKQYFDKAIELISSSIDFSRKNNTDYSFSHGVAGICWCLNHFEDHGKINVNGVEQIDDLFPFLYQKMFLLIKDGKYDFLHESLGIALCLYKKESENKFLDDFIDELFIVSRKTLNGISWYSTHTEKGVSHQVINLSMSHGIAGIISFLCKIHKSEKALSLLKNTTRFLVNQQQDNTIFSSYFPSIISETVSYRNSTLAWCYGDLSIGFSLLRASAILENTTYRDIALNVLLRCSQRRNIKNEYVQDAGFCHGSSGIAHIFNRVYQNTKDEVFKDAALFWLDDCIRKSFFIDGLAGYKVFKNNEWITKMDILEGIAGIGLVLLSTISDLEPTWDECLLLY